MIVGQLRIFKVTDLNGSLSGKAYMLIKVSKHVYAQKIFINGEVITVYRPPTNSVPLDESYGE
jgi:hypothetical protein